MPFEADGSLAEGALILAGNGDEGNYVVAGRKQEPGERTLFDFADDRGAWQDYFFSKSNNRTSGDLARTLCCNLAAM